MSRRTIAPVLTALLNDLFAEARKKKRPGDLQVLRIATDELLRAKAVARAAERALSYAVALDVGVTMFQTHSPAVYPGPPAPLAGLRRALARLRRASGPRVVGIPHSEVKRRLARRASGGADD